MPFGFLAIAAIAALFITIAVYQFKKNQARIASLVQLCASKGWTITPYDPFGLPDRWDGAPFGQGYARHAQNVVTGNVGDHPMVAFDYSYKEDSTDSKGNRQTSTYHYAVVALGMPCALPELQVGPEGMFSRIGKVIGIEDIELESEDFNRRFRVRCPDPKFATDCLPPRTMEHLLANGDVRFRFAGSDAVAFDSGMLTPMGLLHAAHVLAGVVDGVPSFVWRDYGLTEAPATPQPSPGNLT
jgi:hypothetical protein